MHMKRFESKYVQQNKAHLLRPQRHCYVETKLMPYFASNSAIPLKLIVELSNL